jgi:hypothetical protein
MKKPLLSVVKILIYGFKRQNGVARRKIFCRRDYMAIGE